MNVRSWIAWILVTAALVSLVLVLPHSITFLLIALVVLVATSRVPSRG